MVLCQEGCERNESKPNSCWGGGKQWTRSQPARRVPNTAFLSLRGCVNLVSWLPLATAGVSPTQPLRDICTLGHSLLARRKTILLYNKRCDTFPMGPMSSWWSSFFPFPTLSAGNAKGKGHRFRELAIIFIPEKAKTRHGFTQPRTCLSGPTGFDLILKST